MDRAGLKTAVRQGILDEAADQRFIPHDENTDGITQFRVPSATQAGRAVAQASSGGSELRLKARQAPEYRAPWW